MVTKYDDEYTGTRYRYGLHHRPLSTGAVPKGFIVHSNRAHPVFRHGTIDYPKKLYIEQLTDYELTYIGKFINGISVPEEGHYMTYDEIYKLLSRHSDHKTLELFADGWERFPVEPIASKIIDLLESDCKFWSARKPELAEAFQKAINEIKLRL